MVGLDVGCGERNAALGELLNGVHDSLWSPALDADSAAFVCQTSFFYCERPRSVEAPTGLVQRARYPLRSHAAARSMMCSNAGEERRTGPMLPPLRPEIVLERAEFLPYITTRRDGNPKTPLVVLNG